MELPKEVRDILFDPTVGKMVVIAIGVAIIFSIRRVVRNGLTARVEDKTTRYRTRKLVEFGSYVVLALLVATVFSDKLGGFTVAFGVAGAGITILEGAGGRIEDAESVLDAGDPVEIRRLPARLHSEKRELLSLRKSILPLREAIAALNRDENERIDMRSRPYFRDLQDHLVQLVDSVDVYREMIASLLGLHLALVGQKTNEEMRVLTVIGTIFIPLTFIAGIYGMNFEYMPELQVRWGYPALWAFMVAIAGGLVLHFRRQRWV